MLLITATLFAVQIKTDFHANKIVMNIFGAQERPNTDKIRYEYGQVSVTTPNKANSNNFEIRGSFSFYLTTN